jgi:PAS domain S-box-containing protein
MQSDKHFKSNLEPIYKVIDTVYTNDFVLDSNAYIVYMGADLSQLLGISNPVGKSFFEVFKSEKILDVSFFNDDFLASSGRDILKLPTLNSHYRIEARYSSIPDSFTYVSIKINKRIHESNRIAEDLISKIDVNLSTSDFLMEVLYNLPSDIAIFNTNHEYIYLNPSAVKNNEIRDFLIGKTDFDYCALKGLDNQMAEDRTAIFNQVIEHGESIVFETEHSLQDGSIKTVQRSFSPIYRDSNNLMGVLGYAMDITPIKIAQQELEKQKEQFRSLFENNLAGVFRTSEKGEFLEVNASYAKIFGFDSVEEIKTHLSSEFYVNSEDRASYVKLLKRKGILENFLMQNRRRDGELIQLLLNVKYVCEDEIGIIEGTLIDVTALANANTLLEEHKKSLERLAFFLDQTSDGIQVVNENGQLVYLNKTAEESLGIPREAAINHTIFEIEQNFKTKEDWIFHLYDLYNHGKIVIETTHTNIKTLEELPVEITVVHRQFESKNYVIRTSRHIKEKLETERIIDEKSKYLKSLTEAIDASSLVSVTDTSGIIIRANEKFSKVSQYSLDELLGSDHRIINSNNHTKAFWSDMYKTIFSGQIWQGEIRNKRKDGSYYWVNTVIFPVLDANGEPYEFLSIRQEITEAKMNETIIKRQVNFQELLMNISNRLINIDESHLDEEVDNALKEIGLFVDADRSYIFDYNHDLEEGNNLYEWCREGIPPQIDLLQNIPFSELPEWINTHFDGQIMDISNVEKLEESKLKELLEVQGIKSLLAIPMMDGPKCIGFIGFDSVREVHDYTEIDKNILDLFSNMLVNANKRKEFIHQIEDTNKKIIEINENLERLVEEKTASYNELNQVMTYHDKLALIGEITAGITHDLNTPIGAIKVGAESVRFTLESLFKNVIGKSTNEQLRFACNRAIEENLEMFVGGMQMMREKQKVLDYLNEKYPHLEDANRIASELVKVRILENDEEAINQILKSPNAFDFIDLIYHIQTIRTFVDTIYEAGEKSAMVIKNMRLFLKDGSELEKTTINMSESVRTVLNLFNHEIKNKVDLQIDIPLEIEISGYLNKLYQLWSNLIKNALEEIGNSGHLIISAKVENENVVVTFSNTGKMIPLEIQPRIFDKFFTTKSDKNGTGLGLSIVQKVVKDHGAMIKVTSDEQYTSFIVTFKRG